MTTPAGEGDLRDARSRGLDCLRCGSRIESLGVESFRIGDEGDSVAALLGLRAQGTTRIALYLCPICRHIELRAPDD